MRISLAVEGTRGDVYPMLGLGAELERAGHDIVVCAPPGFRDEVVSENATALGRELRHRA